MESWIISLFDSVVNRFSTIRTGTMHFRLLRRTKFSEKRLVLAWRITYVFITLSLCCVYTHTVYVCTHHILWSVLVLIPLSSCGLCPRIHCITILWSDPSCIHHIVILWSVPSCIHHVIMWSVPAYIHHIVILWSGPSCIHHILWTDSKFVLMTNIFAGCE